MMTTPSAAQPIRRSFQSTDGVTLSFLEAGSEQPEPAPATAAASAASLVLGVVTDAAGPLSLLDARAVLLLRSELPSARR